MVSRVNVKIDTTALDNINAFVQNSEQVVRDVADVVRERNKGTVLRVMGEYPRNAIHPFEFESERSRRYYFWMVNNGKVRTDGKRYIRNGKLGKSWKFDVITSKSGVALVIKTDAKMARYVGGTMALSSPSVARRAQVSGHRRTGWQAWVDRIDPLADSIQEDFKALWLERVREVGSPAFKRRGYSTPRRRNR